MEKKSTGNGRAGSFSALPKVRMTNTYMESGDSTLDEMFAEMRDGLLGIGWKYGYTDPVDGTFQFKLAKAYLIENGEKTQILRDVAISGVTLDVLSRVSMVSKELKYDAGHCGKAGQSMSVGSGGPHTLIKNMVIGGQ
jgi:TldD protein